MTIPRESKRFRTARVRVFDYKTSFPPGYIREKNPAFKGEIAQLKAMLMSRGKENVLEDYLPNRPRGCYITVDAEEYGDLDSPTGGSTEAGKRPGDFGIRCFRGPS